MPQALELNERRAQILLYNELLQDVERPSTLPEQKDRIEVRLRTIERALFPGCDVLEAMGRMRAEIVLLKNHRPPPADVSAM